MYKKIQNNMLTSMFFELAAVLALAATPARALTPVTTCGETLSIPGGEYILAADLDCSGTLTNGVNITASNVVFHLAGHTLSSTDCDLTREIQGIVVSLGISGVRIDGGTVSGFNDGIGLNSSNSRVSGMTVTKACIFGIVLSGEKNTVDTSLLTQNGLDGIGLQLASDTLIIANDISDNARLGVDISNNSNHNVVKSNIINNNGIIAGEQGGVGIFYGANNIVANNALNNNFNGIEIEFPGNIARNNKVNGSSNTGIFITIFGSPSTVKDNTVLGSMLKDMADDTAANCAADTWNNNSFQTDLVAGAGDGGPGTGCIM